LGLHLCCHQPRHSNRDFASEPAFVSLSSSPYQQTRLGLPSPKCPPKLRRLLCVYKKGTYSVSQGPKRPFSQVRQLTLFARITEGQYYEAQQQTRVVAARYIKSKTWDAAIDILFSVSQSLLKAGQGGSGGDLGIFLIDVYKQAELRPDAGNKGKLLVLLRLFDPEEPTRKKFIGEMIGYVFPPLLKTLRGREGRFGLG
jgi:hypothetical protein